MDKNGNTIFSSNMKRKWYCSEIFLTQFCFNMFYAVMSSKDLKLKVRTEFPNVYKHHSKPDIHSTV